LIDPDGVLWKEAALQELLQGGLGQRLELPLALIKKWVAEKGYASWSTSRSGARLLFNSNMIRCASLDQILSQLHDLPAGIVLCGIYSGRWRYMIFASPSHAMDCVAKIVAASRARENIQIQSQPIISAGLHGVGAARLAEALELLQSRDWRLTAETKMQLSTPVNGRFLLCERSARSPSWSILDSGRGFESGPFEATPGKFISDQPDSRYGRWLHEQYDQVAASAAARVQSISAAIREKGLAPKTYKYYRVLAPMASSRGSEILLSASLEQQS